MIPPDILIALDQVAQFAERIDGALRLVPGARRSEIARAIHFIERTKAAVQYGLQSGHYGTVTQAHKEAAAHVLNALERLQAALNDPDLAERRFFPLTNDELGDLIKRYADAATKKLPRREVRSIDYGKRAAADWAVRLRRKYRQPVTTYRYGPTCTLAALLYGDANANLFHYVFQILKDS